MKKAIFAAGAVAAMIGTLGSGSAFAASGNTAIISGGSAFDVCIATNGAYTGSSFAADIVGSGFETQLVYDDFMNEACKNVTLPAGNNTISMRKTSGMDVTSWAIAGNKLTFTASETNDAFLRSAGLNTKRTPASVVEVSFNANGGTGSMASVSGVPNVTITLPTNTLTREDYLFNGWNTKADGTGVSYADGATISSDHGGIIELFAQWKADFAVLDNGIANNVKIKKISGTSATDYFDTDTNVRAIKRAGSLPASFNINNQGSILSSSDSPVKIFAWFDNSDSDEDGVGDGVVYYYSEASKIKSGASSGAYMFDNMKSLTDISILSSWDMSGASSLNCMFYGVNSLTDISALVSWDVSHVESMHYMFMHASSLSDISPLASWDTSSLVSMSGTFGSTAISNISALANWNTENVESLESTFSYDHNLVDISPIASWNTSKVKYLSHFLLDTSIRNVDALETKQHPGNNYTSWDVSNVTWMIKVFSSCDYLSNISALSSWDTKSVESLEYFLAATAVTDVDALETKQYPGNSYVSWDVSSVKNMSGVFRETRSLSDIAVLSSWNTSNVKNMTVMFLGSYVSDISALSGWDIANVTDMTWMFKNASRVASLAPIFDWAVGSSVTKTEMFDGIPTTVQRPSWYNE